MTLTRNQTLDKLRELYIKGYRYVVRDKDSEYLSCYSLKPKRYRDTESWGYVNPDVPEGMMAYPIKNIDIAEINYSNRSATLISDFLGGITNESKRSIPSAKRTGQLYRRKQEH